MTTITQKQQQKSYFFVFFEFSTDRRFYEVCRTVPLQVKATCATVKDADCPAGFKKKTGVDKTQCGQSPCGDFPFDLVMGFPHRVSRYANPAPVDLGVFWWDLEIWEASQWTGNGSGIQIDEFSAQTEPYSSIWKDFDDFA